MDMFELPRKKEKKAPPNGAFNVVIFGMDSVSRLNLIRVMPQSYQYIKRNLHAISLTGYNKVGGKISLASRNKLTD